MKKILFLSFFTLFLVSCGASKKTIGISNTNTSKSQKPTTYKKANTHKNNTIIISEADEKTILENAEEKLVAIKRQIIDYAKTFQGTRYKYGGMSDKGMDCSGLVCVAFEKEDITMPRISRDIAKQGFPISLSKAEEGDLVFFKTSRKYAINHVGIVVENNQGEIMFIHASTSAGVIISSLYEAYWKKAFVEVRRVI